MSRNGGFRWVSKRLPLSHLLEGHYIGLEEVGDGIEPDPLVGLVWCSSFGALRGFITSA
jgi:hypothetical protein